MMKEMSIEMTQSNLKSCSLLDQDRVDVNYGTNLQTLNFSEIGYLCYK